MGKGLTLLVVLILIIPEKSYFSGYMCSQNSKGVMRGGAIIGDAFQLIQSIGFEVETADIRPVSILDDVVRAKADTSHIDEVLDSSYDVSEYQDFFDDVLSGTLTADDLPAFRYINKLPWPYLLNAEFHMLYHLPESSTTMKHPILHYLHDALRRLQAFLLRFQVKGQGKVYKFTVEDRGSRDVILLADPTVVTYPLPGFLWILSPGDQPDIQQIRVTVQMTVGVRLGDLVSVLSLLNEDTAYPHAAVMGEAASLIKFIWRHTEALELTVNQKNEVRAMCLVLRMFANDFMKTGVYAVPEKSTCTYIIRHTLNEIISHLTPPIKAMIGILPIVKLLATEAGVEGVKYPIAQHYDITGYGLDMILLIEIRNFHHQLRQLLKLKKKSLRLYDILERLS